jgi:Spy/CpxP family protein refolding chaperone
MITKSLGTILDGSSRPAELGAGMRPSMRSVVLLAMLAVAGTALAQPPASPQAQWQGHHPWQGAAQWRQKMEQRRMERLTVLLDLTPAQRQQVQAILSEEHAKMRAAMQQVQQAMRQARAAHEAARKDTVRRLAAVLDPAQMKKLRVLMPEHPRPGFMMRRDGMGPMPPPGPGPASP